MQKRINILAIFFTSIFSHAGFSADYGLSMSVILQETFKTRVQGQYKLDADNSLYAGFGAASYGYDNLAGERQSTPALHGIVGYSYVGAWKSDVSYEVNSHVGLESLKDYRVNTTKHHRVGSWAVESGIRFQPGRFGPFAQLGIGGETRFLQGNEKVYGGDQEIRNFSVYPYLKIGF